MQRLKQSGEWWKTIMIMTLTTWYTRRLELAFTILLLTINLSFGGNDWAQNAVVNILFKRPLTHKAQKQKSISTSKYPLSP